MHKEMAHDDLPARHQEARTQPGVREKRGSLDRVFPDVHC